MPVHIKFNKKINQNTQNCFAFFIQERFESLQLKNFFNQHELLKIEQIIKKKNKEKNILYFEIDLKKSLILIKVKKIHFMKTLELNFLIL